MKNRTRQKFKKPKRLPYEETEVKSLEIGNLLEKEELKSLEGVSALAEVFVSSESPPIVLDELLPLSLQEEREQKGIETSGGNCPFLGAKRHDRPPSLRVFRKF